MVGLPLSSSGPAQDSKTPCTERARPGQSPAPQPPSSARRLQSFSSQGSSVAKKGGEKARAQFATCVLGEGCLPSFLHRPCPCSSLSFNYITYCSLDGATLLFGEQKWVRPTISIHSRFTSFSTSTTQIPPINVSFFNSTHFFPPKTASHHNHSLGLSHLC